jgi:hypothetical protein
MIEKLYKKEEELIMEQLRLSQELLRASMMLKLDMAEQVIKNNIPEKLSTDFETAESLSSGFKLPLKVKGIFLVEGRPQRRFYTKEEMLKAVDNPVNQRFPIMQDHRDEETSVIVGVVDKIAFDNGIPTPNGLKAGIRWWGHINDETTARNILDGLINEVSASVYSEQEYMDPARGLVGKGLTFTELSTVIHGAVTGNKIEVDLK